MKAEFPTGVIFPSYQEQVSKTRDRQGTPDREGGSIRIISTQETLREENRGKYTVEREKRLRTACRYRYNGEWPLVMNVSL